MKKRIEYIDLAKGICIFLVVLNHETYYYHIEYPFQEVLNSFRLPLYFILSGLFFKEYGGFVDFCIRKTNKLLVPFVAFFILTCLLQNLIFNGEMGGVFFVRELLLHERLHYNYAIWFLPCLFEVNILFYLLQKHLGTKLLCLASLVIGICSIMLGDFKIDLPLYIDNSMKFLPFFTFGRLLNQNTEFLRGQCEWKRDMILITVCFLSGYVLCNMLEESIYIHPLQFYLCGILGTFMILLFARLMKAIQPFSYWGRYSIIILCTHFPILIHVKRILLRFALDGVPGMWLNLVITMALSTICIPLFCKYLPVIVAQKDLFPTKAK